MYCMLSSVTQAGFRVVDPMCGVGTILIEAAQEHKVRTEIYTALTYICQMWKGLKCGLCWFEKDFGIELSILNC